MTESAKPEVCPDCGRPIAARMPAAISPKGPCARNFHPVGADDCIAVTIARLRSELTTARALSDAERRVAEAALCLAKKLNSEALEDEDIGFELGMLTDTTGALLALRGKDEDQ